ncbi:hypothetical protein WN55_02869 [Dufourea novaeangliae]|uniref:Uncharacterized protein n=1 Tax=Dufourea novaeangliae TaxID=178035 RepID=A0A154PIF4_DUFNO|nr:hypothetical protein WN55_02869 [Dufourea novaeangliae]
MSHLLKDDLCFIRQYLCYTFRKRPPASAPAEQRLPAACHQLCKKISRKTLLAQT